MVQKEKNGDPGEKGEPGSPGRDGTNGQDGYTPIKGVDYYTNADKQEMIQEVENDIQEIIDGKQDSMVILSYGNSTWNDFINAYKKNAVVYCRASSASNPATGSQTRLAFMAYVNNATNPTEVEFQYYRSMSSHTSSQQTDQVFVYKLTSQGTWTVTTRECGTKIVAGTGLKSTYSNGVLTISLE